MMSEQKLKVDGSKLLGTVFLLKKGYKQTEIGVLPEDWDVKKLGEIASFSNGKAHEQCIDEMGDFLVVNSKFISTQGAVFKRSNECISPLSKGDITMVMSDIPNGKALARCFTIPEDNNRYTLNQRICSLHSKSVDNHYLALILNRNKYYLSFDSGTGQTNLRKMDVLECPLPLPPTKTEQTAIANALSDADAWIQSLTRLITKKRQIKQGAMQTLLNPYENGRLKEGWVVKKLGDVCDVYSGGTPSTSVASYYGGDIAWITSGDLNKGMIEDVVGRLTMDGLKNSSAKMIRKNTLLIALYGATAGISAISKIEAAINQAVLAIMPNTTMSNLFLFYTLTHRKNWIIDTYTQGGQPNLSGKIIQSIEIACPCLEIQTRIASILSDMDNEIAALETKLAKAQQIKQGMMQNLLTGRIRLI